MQPGPVQVYAFGEDINFPCLGKTEFQYVDPLEELILHYPSEIVPLLSKYVKEQEKHENGCQSSSSATQETGRHVLMIDIAIYMYNFFKRVEY